eukprot:Gregarina_sp_Poly_1__2620@NODE_1712_length_3489_cov_317_420514_g1121_i0_p2_GENE_NODE_1712_length_3489_cov_317_420514_g1121_i0NODE_1712_length_3489_cov_317_420514_g1121_i0_p2_ORF_typecomplete_len384_score51_89Integrin_beta/PF00362_18/2_6e26VWA/PF00092_28/0_0005_NODE_1712_length_3489_cov_317_420514_g1121_i04121563
MKLSAPLIVVNIFAGAEIRCGEPVDVMFLQDTTGSYTDDLLLIVPQLKRVVESISSVHPDSRFGVAEFRDKPYFPLAERDDFCYKLNEGRLSSNLFDLEWAYWGLVASGGGDLPEATYQALIDIIMDPEVGWRSSEEGSPPVGKVIILNTDAVPHLPGDTSWYNPAQYPDIPEVLLPNSGTAKPGNLNHSCLFEDYPSAEQVKAQIQAQQIRLIILSPNDPTVTAAWRWVNDVLLEQPASFYTTINLDSSDLTDKLVNIFSAEGCHITAIPTEPEVNTSGSGSTGSTTTTTDSSTHSTPMSTGVDTQTSSTLPISDSTTPDQASTSSSSGAISMVSQSTETTINLSPTLRWTYTAPQLQGTTRPSTTTGLEFNRNARLNQVVD